MAVTFVTGNEKKWAEVQEILGDRVKVERANVDGTGRGGRLQAHAYRRA